MAQPVTSRAKLTTKPFLSFRYNSLKTSLLPNMSQNGTAKVLQGDNTLVEYTGAAVVSLSSQGQWKIKTHGETDGSAKVTFVLQSDENTCPELALTLGDESTDGLTNATVQELESTPSDNQLWTLEEAAVLERLPPIIIARIQSVARPNLSLTIGGTMALPRLYIGVVAAPNEPGSDTQKWRLDYTSIE